MGVTFPMVSHVKLLTLAWLLGQSTGLGERESDYGWRQYILPMASSSVHVRHVSYTIIIPIFHNYHTGLLTQI